MKIYTKSNPPKRGNALKAWNYFKLNNPFSKGKEPSFMNYLNGPKNIWSGFYEVQSGSSVLSAMTIQSVLLRLLKNDGTINYELLEQIRSQT